MPEVIYTTAAVRDERVKVLWPDFVLERRRERAGSDPALGAGYPRAREGGRLGGSAPLPDHHWRQIGAGR